MIPSGGSDEVMVQPKSVLPTSISSEAVPTLASTLAAASKLIAPNVMISRKSSSSLASGDPASGANDGELRKQLKSKAKEIEALNEECLELEEQVTSLRQEVQEAWDQYKLAQEKAALREAELQDEINILQKAKQTDKQQSVGQISKLNEDIELILQQLQQLREDKQSLLTQLAEKDSIDLSYQTKINELEEELKEARMNSLQGAHHLREEVKQLQIQREQMTVEHTRLLKQLNARQSQLEEENAQLSMAVANNQQELLRAKQQSSQTGSGAQVSGSMSEDFMNREIMGLRQELMALQAQYNTQEDQKQQADVKLRQMERDYRVLQLTHDEYRQRSIDTEAKLQQTIQKLESQLHQLQTQNGEEAAISSQTVSSSGVDMNAYRELKQQVEHLSKMLMKKQSDLIDVTAERTTLKSKILDLQAKVSSLETQVSQLRDLEDGDDDYRDDFGHSSTSSSGFQQARIQDRLVHRGMGRNGNSKNDSSNMVTMTESMRVSNAKVITDLEKIGVRPNASVSKAVTLIDSFALCTGKYLRMNPLIRLAFVVYLILLHVWAFVILVVHTHALEMPSDPRDRVQNRLFKAPMASSTISSMTT